MNDQTIVRAHRSFWIIGVVALVWYVLGCMNFLSQMDAERVAAMPEAYRAIIESRPAWATGTFGIAVFGGALASLLLLFKRSIAYYVFIASLFGVILQVVPFIGMANVPLGVWIGSLMSLAVAVFLIWYTRRAESKGWIS